MTKLRIALTIVSETAFSVGAGGSAGTVADKSIVRDGWGRAIIPGSQVKGKARWAVEQLLRGLNQSIPAPFDEPDLLEQENPVRALFGSPQQRSPLYFADLPGVIGSVDQAEMLRASPEQYRSQIRPSVAINRRRGTAEDARLLLQETTLEGTRFSAQQAIIGQVPDPAYAALLWAGLKLTTRWGGAKARGLGWARIDIAVFLDGSDEPIREDRLGVYLQQMLKTEGSL